MIMLELTCKRAPVCLLAGPGLERPAPAQRGPATQVSPAVPQERTAPTKEGPAVTKEGFTQTQKGSLEGTPPKPPNSSPSTFHFPILRFAYFSNRDCILLETSVTPRKQSPPPSSNRDKIAGHSHPIYGSSGGRGGPGGRSLRALMGVGSRCPWGA